MAKAGTFFLISGVFFGLVSLIHLLRIINGWGFIIGSYSVPMWMSWCAFIFTGVFSFWAFRLRGK